MTDIAAQVAENEKLLEQLSGNEDFISYMEQLAAEWPEEKFQKFVLDYLRDSCRWAQDKQKALEIENAEQRRLGVSYAERKRTTGKIEALQSLFEKWKRRGLTYKNTPPSLYKFVYPEDIPLIRGIGFEQHVKSALLI